MKVKNHFFNIFPEFNINTTRISIVTFVWVFLGTCLYQWIYYYWYPLMVVFADSFCFAIVLTAMVNFVALAIEHDMFETKNADKLLDQVKKLTIGSFVATLIFAVIGWGFYSVQDIILNLLVVIGVTLIIFLFGQILAVSIENGIRINRDFTQKVNTLTVGSFLIIFTFFAVLTIIDYADMVANYEIYYITTVSGLVGALTFSLPMFLMANALAVYMDNAGEKHALPSSSPSLKRVTFDDEFAMELPKNIVSLPDYGFEVQEPIDENFGQLKQWFGGNVSIKYFSFKNDDIRNEIRDDMENIPDLENVPHNKYIIQKDNAKNIYNVFNFQGNYALELSGMDLNLLLKLMDTVVFNKVESTQVASIQSLSDKGIVPLKDSGLSLPATPVCDVCNKYLDVDKSWFVPNKAFYGSQKYRDWNRANYPLSETDSEFNLRMMWMETNDTTEGSAVCEECIELFK